MKTTLQTLLTAIAVVAIMATGASTFTSCATKTTDPAPTSTTPSGPTYTISSWSAKLVGAQSASAGSFFSSYDGNVYLRSQATVSSIVSTVDISYAALGASSQPTLLSWAFRADASTGLTQVVPSGATATYFSLTTLSGTEFDNAVANTVASISVPATAPQSINVATGNVVAFKNAGNKVGLIKVGAITAGLTGDVTITVKVLK
jgi:hypothetical protein